MPRPGSSPVAAATAAAATLLLAACDLPRTAPAGEAPRAPHASASRAAHDGAGDDDVLVAVVGTPFSHDATRGGRALAGVLDGPLTHAVRLDPEGSGLRVEGAHVVGTAEAPAVLTVTVVATDAAGRTATERTPLVVFAEGLAEPSLPAVPFPYSDSALPVPRHLSIVPGMRAVGFLAAPLGASSNVPTDAGAALGRVLFHDRRLSANDRVACASCHLQSAGFGDTARFSVGVAGRTRRHSMAIAGLRFGHGAGLFWDLRAPTLEALVLMPIQDPVEMGLPLHRALVKLRAARYYAPLFEAAFGTREITAERVSLALAQFVRALTPTDAPFDRASAGAFGPHEERFTPQEREGNELFIASCSVCHFSNGQITVEHINSGLDLVSADTGAGGGRFRAPSLRNVAVRPPYMHDGRFATLEEVVEFYARGVQPSAALDSRLRVDIVGPPRRPDFTVAQRDAIVAFLRTLTDSTFLTAERFSDPFARRAP